MASSSVTTKAAATSVATAAETTGPSGLGVIVDERGHITPSIDGAGTLGSDDSVTVAKPAGATVRRAVLVVATTGLSGALQGQVLLNGSAIPLSNGIPSSISSYNYWADVTGLVKGTIDAAAAGNFEMPVHEEVSSSVDGVILAVIFDDPNQVADRSVTLLFGATQTTGDHFVLQFADPIDPTAAGTQVQMSLGSSFSYQTGGVQQYSQIDVNGNRLTTSAGGEDDGAPGNGALITVGGVGDSTTNPEPMATPTGPRSDDELYDLMPYVTKGDTTINVNTLNPSNDDNLLFAAFVSNPPVQAVVTPNAQLDSDGDGLPDDWEEHGLRAEAGLILVDLPKMGADPKHKDVFVRVEGETNADLTKAAEGIVVKAFKDAPVSNPDGKTGIKLHIVRAGNLSFSDSDAMKQRGSNGTDYPQFQKVHDLLPVGWESVAHMAISVHWTNTKWGGLSNGIPGQEFVLNVCGDNRDKHCVASDTAQAATFMHELGHNLGLHHGGDDDIAYKPNYFSVMNYTFADPNLSHTKDTHLGWLTFRGNVGIPGIGVTYSSWGDETLYTLNENSLFEPDGVKTKSGATFPTDVKTFYYCQSDGAEHPLPVNQGANWDCYKGVGTGRVSADINYPKGQRPDWPELGNKVLLHPFNDWLFIQDHRTAFQGGNIGRLTTSPVANLPIA